MNNDGAIVPWQSTCDAACGVLEGARIAQSLPHLASAVDKVGTITAANIVPFSFSCLCSDVVIA